MKINMEAEMKDTFARCFERILVEAGMTVQDRARFSAGADALVDGLLEILKATGAVPRNGIPPATPVPTVSPLDL